MGWAGVLGPGILALGLGVVVVGCLERNPSYDPDGGPACVAGARQCEPSGLALEICTEDATGFIPLRSCFAASHCDSGACVPDAASVACGRAADCAAGGQVCTVLVNGALPDRLGTYCLPPPYPSGRPGGQACATHDECQSGWCFRRVCFEACGDSSDCTNPQHQCVRFDVTVDGVRDAFNVQGCGPPG